jgi:hypothetical protein
MLQRATHLVNNVLRRFIVAPKKHVFYCPVFNKITELQYCKTAGTPKGNLAARVQAVCFDFILIIQISFLFHIEALKTEFSARTPE